MNERIRLLAEQAGWGKGETYDDCIQCSPFDPELFAQLVVRECAEICDGFQARDVGMQPAECAGAIRKMFGVKE